MSPEIEMKASSYLYGHGSSEILRIDDLLDFSNDDIFDPEFSASSASASIPPVTGAGAGNCDLLGEGDVNKLGSDFSDDLCLPIDDVAQLEWLSNFVEDSFSDFPFPAGRNDSVGNVNLRPDASVPSRARSKRSRATASNNGWISLPSSSSNSMESDSPSPTMTVPESGKPKAFGGRKKETVGSALVSGDSGRKCTHCATEKTPQWRTGPMGPKSLCNACGVRYKSGRLVPEYRPAASPTFVLTQHSNSHRKVMELRRQNEILRQENRHEYFHDFKV